MSLLQSCQSLGIQDKWKRRKKITITQDKVGGLISNISNKDVGSFY